MEKKKIFLTFINFLIVPLIIIGLSGDFLWLEGWVFSLWFLTLCIFTVVYLYRHDPALLEERYKMPGSEGEPGWDRYIVYGIFLLWIAWVILMPLDAQRFAWSPPFPLPVKVAGIVGLLISFVFFFRSFADNPYLSPLVRIQKERNQRVASEGVYAIVRHPMYLGAILMVLGAPLLLGSLYGLAVGIIFTFLLGIRIRKEEEMLTRELPGYQDYKKKVRYRLVPLVW